MSVKVDQSLTDIIRTYIIINMNFSTSTNYSQVRLQSTTKDRNTSILRFSALNMMTFSKFFSLISEIVSLSPTPLVSAHGPRISNSRLFCPKISLDVEFFSGK